MHLPWGLLKGLPNPLLDVPTRETVRDARERKYERREQGMIRVAARGMFLRSSVSRLLGFKGSGYGIKLG